MSISSELTLLANTKESIRTSINNKGGSVEASAPFASYATAIDNLPSGGSGNPLLTSIDVSDFTGTTFSPLSNYITSAIVPNGVTRIATYAFNGYNRITSISLPNTLTTLDNSVFSSCMSLTTLTIPSSVTTIGHNCFDNCSSITSLTIPNAITQIQHETFKGCSSLSSFTIPSGVTSIGYGAFRDCRLLTSITIPSNVVSIDYDAFKDCRGLNYVISFPTTPPTLGSNVFNNTNNCPIYVPVSSVDAYKAASGWSTYASRIFAIGDAITFTPTNGDPAISVKNYELTSANYVQSTDVPSTIKNGAGSLEICEGVTRIGTFAFQNGSSLTSVTLPSTLTRIDEAALMGCSSLTGITVNATTPPTLAGAAFSNTNNCPIYVPTASVDTYKAASGWSGYASRIVAIPSPTPSVTSIAFVGYRGESLPSMWGEFEGCSETVNVDAFAAASSSSTFDSDIKVNGDVTVLDNNGNDVTSQCTFTSEDYAKWDSTQDPEYDGESEAYYEWRLDTNIEDTDAQTPHSATITATYENLSDTGTIEWTTTSNCQEPEPDPEEPEE